MANRAPTLLTGDCPYLKQRHSIVVTYLETRPAGSPAPHYHISDFDCDYSEECQLAFSCPLVLNAPKHPPGIMGLGRWGKNFFRKKFFPQ
ncbi:MAG: hypothetical protein LBR56_05135, partial [Sporomusaceae bacterium]|nr:hypothetical protein [Sporomusaceae bacterium]